MKKMFFSTLFCLLPLIASVEQEGYDPTGGVSETKKLNFVDTYKAPSCSMETQENDKIHWHYKGTLLNGHVFDEGDFNAQLGHRQVITGVDKGMRGLCVGDKRKMTIHYDWAYGERGVPGTIPPNSHLVFEVELLSIDRPGVGKVNKDDIAATTTTTNTNNDIVEDGGVSKDNKLKIQELYQINREHCKLQSEINDKISYTFDGYFLNGTEFESGNFTNIIGSEEVIVGFEKGLLEMCVGDERELVIHPDWAYGEDGYPEDGIPPNATLIYDMQLIRIEKPDGRIVDFEDVREFIPENTDEISDTDTTNNTTTNDSQTDDDVTNKSVDDDGKLKLEDTFKSEKCKLISQEDDAIHWMYKGLLLDGTVFDEGRFDATLGHGDVIDGVDQGMRGLCVGDKRTMTMHSDLAYGDEGTDGIPPKATLIFEVELLRIERPDGETAIHYPIDPNTGMTEGQLLKIDVLQTVDDCTIKSQADDTIHWHYKGTFLDGTEFHSGDFYATLGKGHVITGVDKGMRGMCVGEKRRLTIHSDWAYGDEGREGSIPPKATLVFEVEMQKIERPKQEL